MAIRLKQAGLDSFTLYEQAEGIGGTWRDNSYPGAACDVPSHLYSFSFEPNPGGPATSPPRRRSSTTSSTARTSTGCGRTSASTRRCARPASTRTPRSGSSRSAREKRSGPTSSSPAVAR
ncbi:NAD(P)-binding protein [Cystobacter fuscus]